MHYPQNNYRGLDALSWVPQFDNGGDSGMGQYVEAAMAAYSLYESSQEEGQANTDQSEGMPGSRDSSPSVPRQPSALTTVSTAVVTQVSPQISPVMTQQMSSPGATVGANPMQYMPGGLSADQAITPYGNAGMPGFPTNQAGISPYQPYTMDPMTGLYSPLQQSDRPITAPISVGAARMTDIPWIPIAVIAGVAALAFLIPKRKRAA